MLVARVCFLKVGLVKGVSSLFELNLVCVRIVVVVVAVFIESAVKTI